MREGTEEQLEQHCQCSACASIWLGLLNSQAGLGKVR